MRPQPDFRHGLPVQGQAGSTCHSTLQRKIPMQGLNLRDTNTKRLAAYFLLAGLTWILLSEFGFSDQRQLLNYGKTGVATVTGLQCSNHQRFSYEFPEGNQMFRSQGQASAVVLECTQMRIGDRVHIIYLPSDPNISRPGDLDASALDTVGVRVLLSIFVPYVLLLVLKPVRRP
jgi:hypothetical protein